MSFTAAPIFPPLGPDDHVVIVGAGFSGALMATNLVRFDGPRVTLIERRPEQIGRGVAYSARQLSQLLNVRAAGMSAHPDDPGHFTRWLAATGAATDAFVPRAIYGRYLSETLDTARTEAGGRLDVLAASVVGIEDGTVILDDGTRIAADAIVLTLGNLPPHDPPGINAAALPADLYIGDPWASEVAAGLSADDRVVLIGAGLTAIDAALKLDDAGFGGEIVALSRRGLRPRRHVDAAPPVAGRRDTPDMPLSALVRTMRRSAEQDGWRAAVDSLRPVTQRWWARTDDVTRRRFLRHLRPFWDVHRHRLAPAVAERIDALVDAGRIRFEAGKIVRVETSDDGATLTWRPRGQDAVQTMAVRRIVNCTGPQGDIQRSDDPLLHLLLTDGIIRPDALALGIDVDAQSRIIGADGRPHRALYCVGPMTRGEFWEIVAVPDIRRQCADLARRLSNAQWVGEGL